MADDRMRNDDLDRNLSGAGQQKDDFGKQTPGRKPQDDLSQGQHGAGQQGEPRHMKDDYGTSGQKGAGTQGTKGGQGGQNQ